MPINLGKYEKALFYEIFIKNEYSILDDAIKSSNVIFDIGGHIWLFSLYVLSKKCHLEAEVIGDNLDISQSPITENTDLKVYFFEPVQKNFNKASEILSQFPSLVLNDSWISHTTWPANLFKDKISTQSSIYKSFLNKWAETEKCSFIRLDEYLNDNGIESVDLMKMDIEWAEFDVLLNLPDETFSRIKMLFLEFHILDDDLKIKYNELLTKLKKHYIYIWVAESEHDSRVGYILANN